jgi:glucuronoarabinoxylan endo-1,4-beta-xylanase
MMRTPLFSILGALLTFVATPACGPGEGPQTTDSQTNWLKSCEIDAQCGDLTCICGVCTSRCGSDAECADLEGSACVGAADPGAIAQCGGTNPMSGMCLPPCGVECGEGLMCVAGACTPVPQPNALVSVDTSDRRQTLVGFGATIAYGENEILAYPQRDALYSAMFEELGLDVLRLRNRHGQTGQGLQVSSDLVAAATASLGRTPTIFLTAWSPPPSLKANGAAQCNGNFDTCTLTRTPGGAFDYAAFGQYWRDSLEAYEAVGIVPDYIGLQNNPDWVPNTGESSEACRYLPVEGSTTVTMGGVTSTVEYPGFAEAQAATVTALAGLANEPRILAPETSNYEAVGQYAAALNLTAIDAFAHNMYGVDPRTVDVDGLEAVGSLASELDKPVFQTEMITDGLGTARLIHHTTAVEGASAYIKQTLTSSTTGPVQNPNASIGLGPTQFTLREQYFAMQHYALHTDPGWTRVGATSTIGDLLVTAWLSPEEDALTVVLLNSGAAALDVHVVAPSEFSASAEVTRTVFGFGARERAAALGSLSAQGVLTIPARAIVTVAFTD